MNEAQFKKLKGAVEQAKAESDRARGALDTLMEQLKSEFGCEDLKAAKALLEDYKAKLARSEKRFEDAGEAYEKKWAARLAR